MEKHKNGKLVALSHLIFADGYLIGGFLFAGGVQSGIYRFCASGLKKAPEGGAIL